MILTFATISGHLSVLVFGNLSTLLKIELATTQSLTLGFRRSSMSDSSDDERPARDEEVQSLSPEVEL